MPTPAPVSSDHEDNLGNFNPLASRYRVFLDPNEEANLTLPDVSCTPTPTDTEVSTSDAVSNNNLSISNAVKKACRANTTDTRVLGDPEFELAVTIVHLKNSKVAMWTKYKDPILLYNEDQSITHHSFKLIFHYLVASSPQPASQTITVERFVLECLSKAHTGQELAKVVHTMLLKFKIENQVWGVVCDNASNNAAMLNKLGNRHGYCSTVHAKCCALVQQHGCGDSDNKGKTDKADKAEGGLAGVKDNQIQEADKDNDGLDLSMMLDLDGDDTNPEEDEDSVEINIPKMVK
ncbi:hypothetical protein BDV93DRAFT_564931 [Ceratobasidium sp. AG-I]|nr:hypothetical protein BDV93DRAFT_564931 [Ceratobasidium sp. AG-I]